MLIRDKQEEIRMDKHRIMGNSNNSMHKLSRLRLMDKDSTHKHISKTLTNKDMPNKVMPMEIHMGKLKVTIHMVKWEELVHCHLPERNKCHTTVQHLNHNPMDLRDKRTHLKK